MLAIQTGSEKNSVHDGLVLRGNSRVIPTTLQQRYVPTAHQSIVKTKQCIREKVWFHAIDKLVEMLSNRAFPVKHHTQELLKKNPFNQLSCHLNHGTRLSLTLLGRSQQVIICLLS